MVKASAVERAMASLRARGRCCRQFCVDEALSQKKSVCAGVNALMLL